MSTEPLLPSYTSATRRQCPQNGDQPVGARKDIIISAAPVIQSLSFLMFAGTAIVSTVWAYRSYRLPDPVSFQPSPALFPHLTPFSRLRLRRLPSCRTLRRCASLSHSAAGPATLYSSPMMRPVAHEFSGTSLFGRRLLERWCWGVHT
jgi:hypothetical protein